MAAQPAAVSPTQRAGGAAEALALRYLQAEGLRLVAANLRCRAGEIDLILLEGECLVFVEVRARTSRRFGGAAASIGLAKRRRLWHAARFFLHTQWRGPTPRCRFDVLAIDGEEITWLRDAIADVA